MTATKRKNGKRLKPGITAFKILRPDLTSPIAGYQYPQPGVWTPPVSTVAVFSSGYHCTLSPASIPHLPRGELHLWLVETRGELAIARCMLAAQSIRLVRQIGPDDILAQQQQEVDLVVRLLERDAGRYSDRPYLHFASLCDGHFARRNLRGMYASECSFSWCDFSHSDMRESEISRSSIFASDFEDTDLSGSSVYDTVISSDLCGVCLERCDLRSTRIGGPVRHSVTYCSFKSADMDGVVFDNCYVGGCDFTNVSGSAVFHRCVFYDDRLPSHAEFIHCRHADRSDPRLVSSRKSMW